MPLKIHKRGKIWHYRGTVAGRRLRGSTGTEEKAIAQRVAAEFEAAAWSGRLDGPGAKLTMVQAFIAYREAEKPTRFLDRIEDHWRDTLVKDITTEAIRQSARYLYPKAGPATRNRQVITPTQAAINHCAALKWCDAIKVPRFPVTTKPKAYATDEWVTAFQAEASPHLGALCRFMFESAARIGEAVNMTWDDIDFEKRTARVRASKVHEERDARLTPKIIEALANIPSNRCPSDQVFQYQRRDSVRQPWDAAISRAGIKKMSPHCCRHGFAVAMMRAGVDVKTVARWGGWKDVRVLLDTYAHAIENPSIVDGVFGTESTQSNASLPVKYSKQREN